MEENSRERIPMSCPSCSRSLAGARIREKDLGFYDGETHYSRVVGIYDEARDTLVGWRCPHCGWEWITTGPLPMGFRSFEMIGTLPGEGHGRPPGLWERVRAKLGIGS